MHRQPGGACAAGPWAHAPTGTRASVLMEVEHQRQNHGRRDEQQDARDDRGARADDVADDGEREAGAYEREEGCGADMRRRREAERAGSHDGGEGRGHVESILQRVTEPIQSVQQMRDSLGSVGYLAAESTALVGYLARKLGKPVLVEGPAGVGKTELAKALSRATGRRLIRLQCYEGLDEAKALYEWNYRKQLLRIQTEAAGTGWDTVQDDIFGPDFLLTRPLLAAIDSEQPVVLLIDEIDKTDQEFEAMLLEVLSDFQISIPELGVVEARSRPLVLLTSNNRRELTEALKRRCLYLSLDYPALERELEIVRLHAPELSETVSRKLVEVIHMVRGLGLKKPPSIAESIDWARALLMLGADDIDRAVFERTMSIIVKHRTDLDVVAERVGVKLNDGVLGRLGTG